jgi:hypothetical protein
MRHMYCPSPEGPVPSLKTSVEGIAGSFMHPARKFLYVCSGLFLLGLSYQMGVRNASAQAGSCSRPALRTTCTAPAHRCLPTHRTDAWVLFAGSPRTPTQYSSRASSSMSIVVE